MARDDRVDKELLGMCWVPIHFWSKEVLKNTGDCVIAIEELVFEMIIQ